MSDGYYRNNFRWLYACNVWTAVGSSARCESGQRDDDWISEALGQCNLEVRTCAGHNASFWGSGVADALSTNPLEYGPACFASEDSGVAAEGIGFGIQVGFAVQGLGVKVAGANSYILSTWHLETP